MATEAQESQVPEREFTRIERAYCVELGTILTIDEARRAFLTGVNLDQFHFECPEDECRRMSVRIAGVNYRFDAAEKAKLVSNHFRRLDDHHKHCRYFAPACPEELRRKDPGARRTRALHQDLVEEFVPPGRSATHHEISRNGISDGRANEPVNLRPRRARRASTTSLARLVDTYRELVRSQVPNILRDHRIRVRGVGALPIGEYFSRVYRTRLDALDQVIYGGARLAKTYGSGFKLRFMDPVQGLPAFLYVSAQIGATCNGCATELQMLRDGGWCTAYALGHVARREADNSVSIDIQSPEHLLLRLPQRADSTQPSP
jgi:hypothetical protein